MGGLGGSPSHSSQSDDTGGGVGAGVSPLLARLAEGLLQGTSDGEGEGDRMGGLVQRLLTIGAAEGGEDTSNRLTMLRDGSTTFDEGMVTERERCVRLEAQIDRLRHNCGGLLQLLQKSHQREMANLEIEVQRQRTAYMALQEKYKQLQKQTHDRQNDNNQGGGVYGGGKNAAVNALAKALANPNFPDTLPQLSDPQILRELPHAIHQEATRLLHLQMSLHQGRARLVLQRDRHELIQRAIRIHAEGQQQQQQQQSQQQQQQQHAVGPRPLDDGLQVEQRQRGRLLLESMSISKGGAGGGDIAMASAHPTHNLDTQAGAVSVSVSAGVGALVESGGEGEGTNNKADNDCGGEGAVEEN